MITLRPFSCAGCSRRVWIGEVFCEEGDLVFCLGCGLEVSGDDR